MRVESNFIGIPSQLYEQLDQAPFTIGCLVELIVGYNINDTKKQDVGSETAQKRDKELTATSSNHIDEAS